ncbi:phage baseplate assembly protein V [Roseinatronobacter sp. NSM]|uniref:phage baseplate assembly protein V n=1 Tax=Roseinatronobacter sp. NSM TaxID=3457785 RepID=UPI004036C67E
MSFEIAELNRRLANIVQLGRVTAIDTGAMRARVQIGDLTTPMIPVSQLSSGAIKVHWMPSPGEQVVVFAPSGEMGAAVVQGAVPQSGSAVAEDESHPTIELGGAELVITGNVKITGNLTIIGNVDAIGAVTFSEDAIADGVSLVHHTHGGVVSGGGNTGVPNK